MQIKISQQGVKISKPLKQHIETRLGLALGRFADRIRQVTVKFRKAAAGPDPELVTCRVDVTLHRKLRVEAASGDLFVAVDQAVESAARAIGRVLEHEVVSETLHPVPKS